MYIQKPPLAILQAGDFDGCLRTVPKLTVVSSWALRLNVAQVVQTWVTGDSTHISPHQNFPFDSYVCNACDILVRRLDVQAEARVPGNVPIQGAAHHIRDALFSPQRGRARQHLSGHLERKMVVGVQRQHHIAVPPVFASR